MRTENLQAVKMLKELSFQNAVPYQEMTKLMFTKCPKKQRTTYVKSNTI